MFRDFRCIVLAALAVALSTSLPFAIAQSTSSASRKDAAKAVLVEYNRAKDLIKKQESLISQNSKDFKDVEAEIKKVLNAAQVAALTVSMAQASDLELRSGDPTKESSDRLMSGVLTSERIRAQLEHAQLTSTQMALVNKRIQCMESSVQLSQTREKMLRDMQSFQEKLWEFADIERVYDESENRAVLSEFNSIRAEDVQPVLVRGLLRQRLGEYDLAQQDFDSLISQNAMNGTAALIARGRNFELLKKQKESRRDISAARKIKEDDLYVQWLTANYAAARGDWKMAESNYKKALQSKKFDQPLHRSLALVLFESNKKAKRPPMKDILEHAELASKLNNESDWLAEIVYAAALSLNGDQDTAKIHAQNAVAKCPESAKKNCDSVSAAIDGKNVPDLSVFCKNEP